MGKEKWERRRGKHVRKGEREEGKDSKKRKIEKTSYAKKQDWATCELLKLKRVKHLDPKCNFNVKK